MISISILKLDWISYYFGCNLIWNLIWCRHRLTIILDEQTLPLLSSSAICIVLSESELLAIKTLPLPKFKILSIYEGMTQKNYMEEYCSKEKLEDKAYLNFILFLLFSISIWQWPEHVNRWNEDRGEMAIIKVVFVLKIF